jgi:hypothetical protein
MAQGRSAASKTAIFTAQTNLSAKQHRPTPSPHAKRRVGRAGVGVAVAEARPQRQNPHPNPPHSRFAALTGEEGAERRRTALPPAKPPSSLRKRTYAPSSTLPLPPPTRSVEWGGPGWGLR